MLDLRNVIVLSSILFSCISMADEDAADTVNYLHDLEKRKLDAIEQNWNKYVDEVILEANSSSYYENNYLKVDEIIVGDNLSVKYFVIEDRLSSTVATTAVVGSGVAITSILSGTLLYKQAKHPKTATAMIAGGLLLGGVSSFLVIDQGFKHKERSLHLVGQDKFLIAILLELHTLCDRFEKAKVTPKRIQCDTDFIDLIIKTQLD